MTREASNPPRRKLVSVRRVSLIKPLPSSETHEVVMVDGWPVVVEKGHFAVNQQVLYFALDCVIPQLERSYEPFGFSLFPVKLHGEVGWVVQTVKYKDHISQGMVFGLDDSFPEIIRARNEVEEGVSTELTGKPDDRARSVEEKLMRLDLMDDFQVKKWVTFYPIDGGIIFGPGPPSFLPTTKCERAQNMPELWKTHGGTEFQITEILDGIPMIFYDVWEADEFHSQVPCLYERDNYCGISSRAYDYQETKGSISWKAVRKQGIFDNFYGQSAGMAVVGVICGADILGNPHMIDGRRLYVYGLSFYDYGFKAWIPIDKAGNEWDESLQTVERVPKFATGVRLSAFAKDLDELVMKAQGPSCVSRETEEHYPSLKRKGFVFTALDGSWFSFKVIANDWLLDETEKLRKAGQDEIVSRPGPDEVPGLTAVTQLAAAERQVADSFGGAGPSS